MFIEPVNIMGVIAFPNENGKRDCYFMDTFGNELFRVADGDSVRVSYFEGSVKLAVCRYIDDFHFAVGSEVYHRDQFAEIMERIGAIYAPMEPKEGDILDTYEVYQIRNIGEAEYSFRDYADAKKKLKRTDYKRVYRGVLHPKTSFESLFVLHNSDHRPRPQEMRSMSVSDVVVLNRGGESEAYYVDPAGFVKYEKFLK